MERFACFWNGIKLMVVLPLVGCASMMASVQYPQPSKFFLQSGQLKPASGERTKDLFSAYCSGGKQIRNLTINFSFISSLNPQGWSVSEAGSYLKKLNQQRQCLNQKILYRLSEPPDCQTYYGDYVTDLRGKKFCAPANRNEPVWFLSSSNSPSEIENSLREARLHDRNDATVPVFVRANNGRLFGFYFIGQGSSNPNVLGGISKMFGNDLSSIISDDLASLVANFTILEPADFQKKAYQNSEEFNEEKSCLSSGLYSEDLMAIDSEENIDMTESITLKNKIWERYISRFSNVKESVDSANSNKINTQISLDLNAFCRYGRNLNDLTSK